MQTASEMLRAAGLTQAWALKGGAQSSSAGLQRPGSGRPTQKETEKQNKALLLVPKPEGTLSCNKPACHLRPTTADRARSARSDPAVQRGPGRHPSAGTEWPKPCPSLGRRTKAGSEADLPPSGCLHANTPNQASAREQRAQRFGGSLRWGGTS